MKKIKKQTATANKIKKWVQTAKEAEQGRFAISITRLTSIKSICQQDEIAAEQFALYIAQKVQQKMNDDSRPDSITAEEWETHKNLVADAITQMENYLANPTPEVKQTISKLLSEIKALQGDNYRYVHGTMVHFVRSGDLLKIEYALCCFTDADFSYWAYKLAREYVERYEPSYGTGIIPESVPMLLEVAEFWCQYYFGQTLKEKFS